MNRGRQNQLAGHTAPQFLSSNKRYKVAWENSHLRSQQPTPGSLSDKFVLACCMGHLLGRSLMSISTDLRKSHNKEEFFIFIFKNSKVHWLLFTIEAMLNAINAPSACSNAVQCLVYTRSLVMKLTIIQCKHAACSVEIRNLKRQRNNQKIIHSNP